MISFNFSMKDRMFYKVIINNDDYSLQFCNITLPKINTSFYRISKTWDKIWEVSITIGDLFCIGITITNL